jgi:predicted GNAT family acetyltransferase
MGVSEHVLALETAIRREPLQTLEYHLMVQDQPLPDRPYPRVPSNLLIRQASERDTDYLFDIQKKYEIEEVLLAGSRFNSQATRAHLHETLRTQVVYLAEVGDTPVAKAGTNARGRFYDQLGGVFTESNLRSRGIGSLLMTKVLEHIGQERKSGTLFVKRENAPAVRMYRSLGFGVQDAFRISYFR